MSELVYDCDGCGLCCRHLIIEAELSDALREPRIVQRGYILDGRGKLPILDAKVGLTDVGGCVFLGDDNRCGIYATRPHCCVAFIAGSPKCAQLRSDHGKPPLVGRKAATFADRVSVAVVERENDDEGARDQSPSAAEHTELNKEPT